MENALTPSANCFACRGACCEEFSLPALPTTDDASRWFGLHGTLQRSPEGASLRFECRCTMLSPLGRCTVYDLRPQLCQDFPAGGPACREVVLRRRGRSAAARILTETA